jgi:hypothetical protein
MEDLDGVGVAWPEPVWFGGVEPGHLAGTQRVFAVPDDESQRPREDVEPFVALVGDESGFAWAEHLFEDLHSAGVVRERDQDAPAVSTVGFQVDTWVAGRGRRDELVQRNAVGGCERSEQIEGGFRLPDSSRDSVLTETPVTSAKACRVIPRSRRSCLSRGPILARISFTSTSTAPVCSICKSAGPLGSTPIRVGSRGTSTPRGSLVTDDRDLGGG